MICIEKKNWQESCQCNPARKPKELDVKQFWTFAN